MSDRILQILVVEDDSLDQMIFKKALKSSTIKYELHFADDHESGKEATAGKEYDCIFLDYNLPGGTGLELLKSIRASGNSSPIIIVTSQGDEMIAAEAIKNGANDYIPKVMLTTEGIAQSVRYMVNMKEQESRQRELETKLRNTEKQLSRVAANSPIVLFALDKESNFTLFEGKALEKSGVDAGRVIGRPLNRISQFIPELDKCFSEAIRGEENVKIVNFGDRFFEVFTMPSRNEVDQITGVIGVASDITVFKKAEEELIRAAQLAEETAKVKEQFLANMSHEIRTPMNGIIGLTRVLKNTSLDGEQKKYLDSIMSCSENLMVIINDILDFSKIEAGKMTFESVSFHFRNTLQHSIELFQAKADEKKLHLVSEIDSAIPEILDSDPTRLSQVLNNLISNAIKFTEEGEIRISARLKSRTENQAVIRFDVKDSGIGIPEKSLDSIFDSFTQASSETTRKFGGTGLGLTIVKRIIELQGGSIGVKSKVGQGTTFSFELTMAVSEKQNTPEVKVQASETATITGLRILIAEDNKINQLVVKKIIGDWQAVIEFADNGKIAVEKAQSLPFDIILMDIQMPVMDGYTAAREIRALGIATPIIAMTAHAMAAEKQKCFDQGMTDYICKPFDPDDLKNKILTLTREADSALNQARIENPDQETTAVKINTSTPAMTSNGASESEIRQFLNAPKINLNYLKQIADGNDAFVAEMIEMFINKTPQALEEMAENFRKQNWEELKRIAHRIKPSFGYIGMSDIQSALARIEVLSEEHNDAEQVNQLIHTVEESTRVVCDLLKKELNTLK
ncbi:MAG: response regulator [Bacteroidia bacterium]